ncbi:MAG: hypothetical protein JNL01_10495 [Bdellovibrionales bacterium]|nr:hypothetical protein [Bdellovibrionales bacterium]
MEDFIAILPELFLAFTVGGLIFSEIGYYGERYRLVTATAVLGLLGAAIQTILATAGFGPQIKSAFSGVIWIDPLTTFFRLFFIVLTGLATIHVTRSKEVPAERKTELLAFLVASTAAYSLIAASNDLVLTWVAFQLSNALIYFLGSFGVRNVSSTEASFKFLGFSMLASVLFALGVLVLFAATEQTQLSLIRETLQKNPLDKLSAWASFALLSSGLCFQFAAFPSFTWAPDVLQGVPTPISSFAATATRVGGFSAAIRIWITLFSNYNETSSAWTPWEALPWPQILAWVAGLSLVFGSVLAVRQNSARRLLGSLVVSQTGFVLLGLLVLDTQALGATLFSLLVELFALSGCYFVIARFVDETSTDQIDEWKGMLRKYTGESAALILFLGCFVGIPPLGGFFGRFSLVGAAVDHHWGALAAVALFSWALSWIAISRLCFALVGDFSTARVAENGVATRRLWSIFVSFGLPLLVLSIFTHPILVWVTDSLRQLK